MIFLKVYLFIYFYNNTKRNSFENSNCMQKKKPTHKFFFVCVSSSLEQVPISCGEIMTDYPSRKFKQPSFIMYGSFLNICWCQIAPLFFLQKQKVVLRLSFWSSRFKKLNLCEALKIDSNSTSKNNMWFKLRNRSISFNN